MALTIQEAELVALVQIPPASAMAVYSVAGGIGTYLKQIDALAAVTDTAAPDIPCP